MGATSIGGCRHWEIEFDRDGALIADGGLVADVESGAVTDLVVFCHGWNTSVASARGLGHAMFELIAERMDPARRASTGLVTLLWPSLLFPEDEPAWEGRVMVAPAPPARAPVECSGHELALALAPAFPDQKYELTRIGTLLDTRPPDPGGFAEFHRLASGLVTSPNTAAEDDGESTARTTRTRTALEGMATLAALGAEPVPGRDLWEGGRDLLRVLSYYEMKNRAGVVGRVGLGPLLTGLRTHRPELRAHLVGHSFGGRLVSFALAGLPEVPASPVGSLVLVQAAFSHYAFAPTLPHDPSRSGALAGVADRVNGPLLATYSVFDRAVGWWYPNASILARQDNQVIAEFTTRWGGLGFDGFQQDGVVDRELLPVGGGYEWRPRTLYRLDANKVINRDLGWLAGAHSDIRKPELAWAVVTAAGLAP
ncbi:hypothetical protein [Pseudonocardia acaciae]|uniref:hypothetical protein n=1 Tax=Pseudonocardia acaciae TaxID=551276 RepID=UPI00055CEB74|nr:hypothetical protein [Pseudonocardia acaciae]